MAATLTPAEEAQLAQTIEMFEVITQSQPLDYQSLEILKEAYYKLGRQKEVVNTSKRIAQAYMQLGQLSSAILEYESILQRYPDDPDVQAALAEIESKAGSFPAPAGAASSSGGVPAESQTTMEVDDGRGAMYRLFVEGKLISANDFNIHWRTPDLHAAPKVAAEPFIQVLQDKGLVPIDKSIKLICDRSRLAYLPLEKYDIDIELARSFPRELCLRWGVLPYDRLSKSVLVATANPFNKQAASELEHATKSRLIWYMTHPTDLLKALRKTFR